MSRHACAIAALVSIHTSEYSLLLETCLGSIDGIVVCSWSELRGQWGDSGSRSSQSTHSSRGCSQERVVHWNWLNGESTRLDLGFAFALLFVAGATAGVCADDCGGSVMIGSTFR